MTKTSFLAEDGDSLSLTDFPIERRPDIGDPSGDFLKFVVERVPIAVPDWWPEVDGNWGDVGTLTDWWESIQDGYAELSNAVEMMLEHIGFPYHPELYGERSEWSTSDKIRLLLSEFLPDRLRYTSSGAALHRALRDCLWVHREAVRLAELYRTNHTSHLYPLAALSNCLGMAVDLLNTAMRSFRRPSRTLVASGAVHASGPIKIGSTAHEGSKSYVET